ncbi:MAG: hypothetical protein GWO08_02890, partial [Gammaproteobacteria bacterium]|nr:hypothetical protein [Gammaproteobacteria bacterium]NIR92636.1 hypothetical protein [Gammaproteobacteria bacterium]
MVAVMFAYTVRFLAIALKTIDAGLTRIKPSMEEAGRSIGISGIKLLRK